MMEDVSGVGHIALVRFIMWDIVIRYNEFDFFLENKEYRPFHGCKIEI